MNRGPATRASRCGCPRRAGAGRLTVAIVTAAVARDLDDDLPPLVAALDEAGVPHRVVDWDDPGVNWAAFALVVVRSVWDYPRRRDELLDWAERVAAVAPLANPPPILRWNSDKRYLARPRRAPGCRWCRPPSRRRASRSPGPSGQGRGEAGGVGGLDRHGDVSDVEGSWNERAPARRGRTLPAPARRGRLGDGQPYLSAVEGDRGETAVVFWTGRCAHACRQENDADARARVVGGLFVEEDIRPATPRDAERGLGERDARAIPGGGRRSTRG